MHLFQTADGLQILEDLAAAVDRPAVRGIVHGACTCMGAVLQVDGKILQIVTDEVFADDADHHARRTDVLLHARVDHAVVGHVAGLGQEHGRLVGDQRMTLGVGQLFPRHAVDGFVLADVDIVGVFRNVQIGAVGNVGVVLVLGGRGDDDLADLLRLGDCLLGPCAGLNVDSLAVLHEVHRNHGELQRCAALNEQNFIVVGDTHQIAQILLGFVNDLLEHGGAMRHLHDAHTAAAVVHHLVADFLQNRLRHHGRTGRKVKCTTIFHNMSLLRM